MIKQRILSVVAAVLSLLIVFMGWLLTNDLLNRQHLNLMNRVNSISVKEVSENELSVEPAKVTLNSQEISNILKVMHSGSKKHYHDPYDEQLTMEEAIKAANSGLSYFCDKGVLSKEFLKSGFTRTNAFLYDLQSVGQIPKPVGTGTLPDPAYSFWSINLSNHNISVNLTLNALTGQIWMADISSSSINVNFDSIKVLDILEQYEAYLGLTSSAELRSDEAYAFKSYENNQIGITIHKRSGRSGHYESLHFSLISASN